MATTVESLAAARRHHRAGELAQAERIYRQVLQVDPNHAEALYLLGEACRHLRKLDEAAVCFRRLLTIQPGNAEAWNYLGVVHLNRGKLDEATACYQEAVRLQPDLFAAQNNLGDALLKQGKLEQAEACLRQALLLRPDRGELHYNLGKVLQARGQGAEARTCLERAVRLKPDLAQGHSSLGILLVQEGEDDAALPYFEQAVRLQPREASAHSNLATALVEQGKAPEAADHYREALRLNPNCIAALGNVAIHDLFPLTDDQIGRIHTLLTHPRLPLAEASILHFALANLRSRAGDDEGAFDHFHQGNALRRRLYQQTGGAFDPEAHRRETDRRIRTFTPEYFRRVEGFGLDTETPLFIVGMPRSGTTLVEQILSRHPAVFGAGELADVGRLAEALNAPAGGHPPYADLMDRQKVQVLAGRHLERLTRLGGAALRVSDKMPTNFLHLGVIATLFPRARVVHCRRDPLDTCVSCYLQHFHGLNFTYDLTDLGAFYREYERLMAHWRAALPLRLLEVSYEELVSNQEEVSRRMVAFCGLDWDERCLSFHENPRPVHTRSTLQVRRPIYTSSVGRWKRYEKHLQPLREALTAPEGEASGSHA